MKTKKFQSVFLAVLVLVLVVVVSRHQALADWLRLRGYTAPAEVAQLAAQDTMTSQAKHLFDLNHPAITSGTAFSDHCPAGTEKTVVLGCYVGDDAGIYVYQVDDTRLNGVEQVTAAHETLHAAYRRLPEAERARVDAMLTDYYAHGLTDQRVKDTIAAYKKSEPSEVVNEMHSVFGTEIANLPAPLEQYYSRYFTDRARITDYTAQYQSEFTDRQYQIKAYDTQLSLIKSQIDDNETQLSRQKAAITSQNGQLQAERGSGQIDAYNRGVDVFNADVDAYNSLLGTTKDLINQYNTTVTARNNIALEEQQLTRALSSSSLPAAE